MYQTVSLEISLKPFRSTDEDSIRKVCAQVFEQWRPLLKHCKTVSVMLWTADGSEMLDYAGNPEDSFEWCRYIGTANLPENPTGDDSISPHTYKYLYTEHPSVMTYAILRNIVRMFKEEGRKAFPGMKILVGNTFDIGPEFALSDFKYNRHTEICTGSQLDRKGFVDCTALLHADTRKYAAYPDGIPEGTPIGTFLGKQSALFLRDMGMDFLWLSNGFGFSADPWKLKGKVFDGETFHTDKLTETRRKVFEFWKYFREACPDIPLQVRGTNNSVGIDYATDAVPLYEIYRGGFNITPPPNSPWAAIDDDYGLELMGHMTRICELPGEGFLFRYYIHDPWWANSPWYDRYNQAPTDIYLPMAVSRIDEKGRVETARNLNLLSVDNSFGNMPDSCVQEPLPHLMKAKKDAGDAPAPLVWVYPMREYSTATDETTIAEMYYGDTFLRNAINATFPLNCVVSTDIFLTHPLELYRQSILLSPIPETPAVAQRLTEFARSSGKVIFYGTRSRWKEIPMESAPIIDSQGDPAALRKALEAFGYIIRPELLQTDKKSPAMTIARSNNGMFFSVYNPATTTDTLLRFPLGVPVLLGGDVQVQNGLARYRFSRWEHRECRVFVEQSEGFLSAYEYAPVNKKYRRKFRIDGLQDATVCYFPEEYCKEHAAVADGEVINDETPVLDDRFHLVHDPEHGTYYRGEHITGSCYFLMPFPEYVD